MGLLRFFRGKGIRNGEIMGKKVGEKIEIGWLKLNKFILKLKGFVFRVI